MKKGALLAILVLLAFWGGRALVIALASDETHIRWAVERMEEGFNDRRAGACVRELDPSWRHNGEAGFDREILKRLLIHTFLTDRMTTPEGDKIFPIRGEVLYDTLAIAVDGDSAELWCEVRFERYRAGEWLPKWHIRIDAGLRETDDGWRFVRSSHDDLEGRGLGR